MVAVLLTNIKTCVDVTDNQVLMYFNCKPLTLLEYLGSVSQKDRDVPEEDTVEEY
jgi:hypothetical protein